VRPEHRRENHRLKLHIVSTLARTHVGAQSEECDDNNKEKHVPHVYPLSRAYIDGCEDDPT
jgi:hypothetical protein